MLRAKLTEENRAATTIAAYVRGLLQRRKFAKLKWRHYAATVIQAYARFVDFSNLAMECVYDLLQYTQRVYGQS